MFDITTRESQLLELQQELKEKRKIIEEKDTLLEKTLKELEIINETLNKQSQDILDLEKSKKEAYRDVSELQIAQKVFIEENNVLKESNEKLYEKFTECETQIKGFKIKINDLQNSHLNIAKNHNEKIGEMQKKIEESLKWREEAKKLEECIKGYKEKLIQSEEIIENLNLSLKNNNNENIELNEKMKIKIKGYSILKSHFYTKYEEIIKLLIQKDKQLEMFKMKNIRNEFNEKENKIKTVEFYELFKKNKKENGENNDLENEINKDLLMLKDDKLFEKVVLEPIDTNNIK